MSGFFSRLFGRQQKSQDSSSIMFAYAAVLEKEKPGMAASFGLRKLPFDKSIIKDALVELAVAGTFGPSATDSLKAAFLQLGAFQIGGGEKSAIDRMLADVSGDPEKLQAFLKANGSALERERELAQKINEDTQALNSEWNERVGNDA